ncbi:hypothetical protein ZIOFF_042184 [Zingiber officinale]|uniref:Protein FAR1-RELATED SEQUENCE n=1 Tax=Zingiber officinale TaxID=94328 RepID=A0A8J5G835_ZINOF|nr:hypothetical protein ZIOFF_042184 [Zingiber officinale]
MEVQSLRHPLPRVFNSVAASLGGYFTSIPRRRGVYVDLLISSFDSGGRRMRQYCLGVLLVSSCTGCAAADECPVQTVSSPSYYQSPVAGESLVVSTKIKGRLHPGIEVVSFVFLSSRGEMEGTISEDDGLIPDGSMDLNGNSSDPQMDLALGALGIELNLDGTDLGEPCIGMEFESDEVAKEYYIAYANRIGFGVRMNKSRRSRKDDTVIMRRFVCTKEGFHSKRVIYDDGKKKRKRGTTREGCMAMIEVIRKDHGKWVVTKLITEHSHVVAFPDKAQPPLSNSVIHNNSTLLNAASSGGFSNLKNFSRGIRVNPCKQKLSDVYSKYATLKTDLKECINQVETIDEFETRWEFILDKYNLWDNPWLQSLYEVRHQWAPAYQRGNFSPELSASQRSESLNKFFKRNFNSKTSLLVFIARFDQEMASACEKEAQADFAAAYTRPLLKTPSPIEKQAAAVYTKEIFEKFQEEFIESLGYYVNKIEDGPNIKYSVIKEEENNRTYFVHFNEPDKTANCSCCKFESSGILCRHIFRVFFTVGVHVIPECYILKRWTRNAASTELLDERAIENGSNFQDCLLAWYNDLCVDAVKYGIEGALSSEIYKVAKAALQKAFTEVVSAKNAQRKGQQNMQRFARLQKMQFKMPLPKLQAKKTPARSAQEDGDRDKRCDKDASLYDYCWAGC